MKRILLTAVVVAGLVGVAGPAEANRPPTQTGSFVLTGTDTASAAGYCQFDVRIDYVSHQKVTQTAGPDNSTVFRATGNATATATNVTSGKAIHYNISGPGTTTSYPDGAFTGDNTGPFLLFTTVGNSYPGVPQLAYTTGHVRFSVAASQLTTSYELNGHSTDVCAALA